MHRLLRHLFLVLILMLATSAATALDVRFERVTDNIYVYVGETGPRTHDNEGLNANIGLIVTATGSVLVDSGASFQSAKKIDEAVKKVTAQPIRWVINTGGQDHRWLGNGYFFGQGAELIAHSKARTDMLARGGDQLAVLKTVLKERADGTVPALPTRLIEGNDVTLDLGGTTLVLYHRGGGHTPGDMMVWLPDSKVLFSGDIVYVERMLSVIPVSNSQAWVKAFQVIEDLAPRHLVPGHGKVSTVDVARADTADYLLAIRAHMKKAVDEALDLSTAVKSFNAETYMRLLNAADLMPGNASRIYLELERE